MSLQGTDLTESHTSEEHFSLADAIHQNICISQGSPLPSWAGAHDSWLGHYCSHYSCVSSVQSKSHGAARLTTACNMHIPAEYKAPSIQPPGRAAVDGRPARSSCLLELAWHSPAVTVIWGANRGMEDLSDSLDSVFPIHKKIF